MRREPRGQDFHASTSRLLDLHGNANNRDRAPDGGKDENVFDIQGGRCHQPVLYSARQWNRAELSRAVATMPIVWGKRASRLDGTGKYDLACRQRRRQARSWASHCPLNRLCVCSCCTTMTLLHDEYGGGWRLPKMFSPSVDPEPGIDYRA